MVDDKVQRIEIHLHLFAFFFSHRREIARRTNELQASELAMQ